MKSIAFFNNKGGVGKTTLLCNVAAHLSLHENKSVLVVDADPQCNASQYMFTDEIIEYLYEDTKSFTIYNIVKPLSEGRGYSKHLRTRRSKYFAVDVVPGDPRLALTEDLLARDWSSAISGDTRGIRTSLLFVELLQRCSNYDYVLIDVGPSLGSINRAVILASDYFISPMSIDIFSLKAIENTASWFENWTKQWKVGMTMIDKDADIPKPPERIVKYAGYVSQQYIAKTDATGTKRAVNAYEKIMSKTHAVINEHLLTVLNQSTSSIDFNLGSIPNLHSLLPMSQTSRKPVFELRSVDGVKGAHFAKVRDSEEVFGGVSRKLLKNIQV